MLNSLLATLVWTTIPIIKTTDGAPTTCGIHFFHQKNAVSVKVEKKLIKDYIVTSLTVEVPQKKIDFANIQTKSVDTAKILQKQTTNANFFFAQNNLEQRNSGGLLMFELVNFGGIINYTVKSKPVSIKLPERLPRDISALYLNCSGDLIRPENEISSPRG